MSRLSSMATAHRFDPEPSASFAPNLPDPNTVRWVPSRKAQLISAIESGVLSADEAAKRYRLTSEELAEWKLSYSRFGARGLKATLVQQIRHARRA